MVTLTYLCNNLDNTVSEIIPNPCQSAPQQERYNKWIDKKAGNVFIEKGFDIDNPKNTPSPWNVPENLLSMAFE